MSQPPVGITGVWLRTGEGQKLQVLVEVDGKWRLLRSGNGERYTEGEISQIWEARGFRDAHLDPVTERA